MKICIVGHGLIPSAVIASIAHRLGEVHYIQPLKQKLSKIAQMPYSDGFKNKPNKSSLPLFGKCPDDVFGVKKYNVKPKGYYVLLLINDDATRDIGYENLGFDSDKDGRKFYEKYLKHAFCYLIEFIKA